MAKLNINFENCFGIKKLEQEFDFSQSNSVLIYAPNGIMKTSFSKTFDCIAKKITPNDKIHPERKSIFDITMDGVDINPEQIFVANANEPIDASDKISTFLASKELKEQYDLIYKTLEAEKSSFIKDLKTVSQSADCEHEFLKFFGKEDIFTCLASLENEINKQRNIFKFKYNNIFDKNGKVKNFLDKDKNKSLIRTYSEQYSNLLKQSDFFYKSEEVSFGTYEAKILKDSISNGAFFDANHSILLRGKKTNISSHQELESHIDNEVNKILNDPQIKSVFEKIDKAITANSDLRLFKQTLDNEPDLIPYLDDYEQFQKDVWFGYLYALNEKVNALLAIYNSKKTELDELVKKSQQENEIWKNIIEIFNERFFVPFIVKLDNQEDIILKQKTANLKFEYIDENKSYVKDQHALIDILSRGELRAFNILQILFEITSRKNTTTDNIIIFDDIADSFDYRNKHAIVEYIKDLNNEKNFKIFILTHNFDFYRNIASRVNINRNKSVFMAIKNKDGKVELKKGQYLKDIFSYYSENGNKEKIFISLLPFIRNLVEYTKGSNSSEYEKLTNCLHIKDDTNSILTHDIYHIYNSGYLRNTFDFNTTSFSNKNMKDFIYEVADSILKEPNIDPIILKNKIVLSIAIRLKTEEYLIKQLSYDSEIDPINANQTIELINRYKEKFPNSKNIMLIERVNMMTPENIHLNSFMYEPLVDMSIDHLTNLYSQISNI